MNKNVLSSVLFFGVFTFCAGYFIGGGFDSKEKNKVQPFACVTDYKDWIVRQRDGNTFIIQKGCVYDTIKLPDYYLKYELGDTLTRKSESDRELDAAYAQAKYDVKRDEYIRKVLND